jgi:hypothetical protein
MDDNQNSNVTFACQINVKKLNVKYLWMEGVYANTIK